MWLNALPVFRALADLRGWASSAFLAKFHDRYAVAVPDLPRRLDQLLLAVAFLAAGAIMHLLFGVRFPSLASQVQFTKQQFDTFVTTSMHVGMVGGGIFFLVAIVTALIAAWRRWGKRAKGEAKRECPGLGGLMGNRCCSPSRRRARVLSTALNAVLALLLFTASLETLRWNDEHSTLDQLPLWPWVASAQRITGPFSAVNPYGLFRRMTGVGGRPELTVEGSNDRVTWEEYRFKFKPNGVADPPPVIGTAGYFACWVGRQSASRRFAGLWQRCSATPAALGLANVVRGR